MNHLAPRMHTVIHGYAVDCNRVSEVLWDTAQLIIQFVDGTSRTISKEDVKGSTIQQMADGLLIAINRK